MNRLRLVLVATLALVLAGCESAPIKGIQEGLSKLLATNQGEADLEAGIRSYDNGNFRESARQLQIALDAGLGPSGQVTAHKYLAFIHCAARREGQCRSAFRAVLDVDPSFELDAAEAGHPIWGPVFRSEKDER